MQEVRRANPRLRSIVLVCLVGLSSTLFGVFVYIGPSGLNASFAYVGLAVMVIAVAFAARNLKGRSRSRDTDPG